MRVAGWGAVLVASAGCSGTSAPAAAPAAAPAPAPVSAPDLARIDAQVVRLWMNTMRTLLNRRALAKDHVDAAGRTVPFGLEDAKVWARERLPGEIAAGVAKALGITVEEARAGFGRGKRSSGNRATYGGGTFIVEQMGRATPGAAGCLADQIERLLPPGDDPGLLEKLLPEALRVPPTVLQTPGEWWASADGSERREWMTASHAELGGDMEVVRTEEKTCNRCAGKGFLRFLVPGVAPDGGGLRFEICKRCHGCGHDRVVVFR